MPLGKPWREARLGFWSEEDRVLALKEHEASQGW